MERLLAELRNAHDVQRRWKSEFDTNPPTPAAMLSVNQKFDGEMTIKDLSRSSPPIIKPNDEKLEEIKRRALGNPWVSVRQSAFEVGINQSSCRVVMK